MNPFYRKFGCEFEYSTRFDDFASLIRPIIRKIYRGTNKIVIKQDWYRSNNNKQWHLKTDSTTECELVTPVSTIKDLPKICKVMENLDKKTKITHHDSFHVHMQAKDIKIENIIISWMQIEHLILKCFPRHRRVHNTFCPRLVNEKSKNIKIADVYEEGFERAQEHHAILSTSYCFGEKHNRDTVEFRIAEGTTDKYFVCSWVKFLMFFLDYAKRLDSIGTICSKISEINDLDKMIDIMEINDADVYNFLRHRYGHFG